TLADDFAKVVVTQGVGVSPSLAKAFHGMWRDEQRRHLVARQPLLQPPSRQQRACIPGIQPLLILGTSDHMWYRLSKRMMHDPQMSSSRSLSRCLNTSDCSLFGSRFDGSN